jgi:hypothetical protein
MPDDEAFIWETPRPQRRSRRAVPRPAAEGRISLREAEQQFGVRAATLRTWARKGTIDGIQSGGPRGDQWMVTPESIAHHLSRNKPQVSPTTRRSQPKRRSGPSDDGSSMLVPRDAWDKLMDQLGNLHDAGLRLAEARERAAKAETEAAFLRERLAEMRAEREPQQGGARSEPGRRSWWARLRGSTTD